MGEVGAIAKGRTNKEQGYAFRGIDDLYAALQGPLSAAGVFFAPEIISVERGERLTKSGTLMSVTLLTVSFTFYADDGSTVKVTTVGEGADSGDKSANKAMSAALKYALLQLFCIPTQDPDEDTENASPEFVPRPPASEPKSQPRSPAPRSGAPRPTVAPGPAAAPAGPACDLCKATLLWSEKTHNYYCPNYKDKALGEHTSIHVKGGRG